jgi:hypothetical protein
LYNRDKDRATEHAPNIQRIETEPDVALIVRFLSNWLQFLIHPPAANQQIQPAQRRRGNRARLRNLDAWPGKGSYMSYFKIGLAVATKTLARKPSHDAFSSLA